MLWDNKPLNKLVESIYDCIAEVLGYIRDKASDTKILREIVRLREVTTATREEFDPDHEYDEFNYILRFLDVLEYAVHTKEKWEY